MDPAGAFLMGMILTALIFFAAGGPALDKYENKGYLRGKTDGHQDIEDQPHQLPRLCALHGATETPTCPWECTAHTPVVVMCGPWCPNHAEPNLEIPARPIAPDFVPGRVREADNGSWVTDKHGDIS